VVGVGVTAPLDPAECSSMPDLQSAVATWYQLAYPEKLSPVELAERALEAGLRLAEVLELDDVGSPEWTTKLEYALGRLVTGAAVTAETFGVELFDAVTKHFFGHAQYAHGPDGRVPWAREGSSS
jgi:hypothetical protein